jgi:ABC-type bacteriocin/lantibiotic exporter with double-glycine peptidase domain
MKSRSTLSTLGQIINVSLPMFIICVIYVIFISALAIAIPVFFKFILDVIIPDSNMKLLHISFIVLCVYVFARLLMGLFQDYIVQILMQQLERYYISNYFNKAIRLTIARFTRFDTGDLISRMVVVMNQFKYFIVGLLYFVFYALFLFLFLGSFMYSINKILFLLIVVFLPVHFINFTWFNKRLKIASDKYFGATSTVSAFFKKFFDGIIEIKNYLLTSRFGEILDEKLKLQYKSFFARKVLTHFQTMLQNFLIQINIIVILGVGGWFVYNGSLTIGNLLIFVMLLHFFYEPVYRFSYVNDDMNRSVSMINNIGEILESPDVEEIDSANGSGEPVECLAVDGLTFSYKPDRVLFENVNARFYRGSLYMIRGESGCGKSTLCQLLTSIMKPTGGEITLNGKPYSDIGLRVIRTAITYCSQPPMLFKGTVQENILFHDDHDEKRLESALYTACCSEFIRQLPGGLFEPVHEGGSNFSGGQRQRLSLARAIYRNSDIMIFDEPASSLDVVTHKLFFQRLSEIKRDKIIIVISHNDETLRWADQVLQLSDGKLVATEGNWRK